VPLVVVVVVVAVTYSILITPPVLYFRFTSSSDPSSGEIKELLVVGKKIARYAGT